MRSGRCEVCGGVVRCVLPCCRLNRALDVATARVIVAIVCTFGLGIALQNTGMAGFLASGLVDAAGEGGDSFLLFSIFAVACLAGSVVSNNANVILMYPICVKVRPLLPALREVGPR